ncbi:MAG: hypothetical protein LC713_05240 [Actinobacteria bacterium]|nr:hypothetical protein [Actinomycetota bacterium]
MPADQAQVRPRRGGRVVLAAMAGWLLYRAWRRALKLAVLAGVLAAGAGLAKHQGIDLSAIQRIARCEVPTLIADAAQLPQLLTPTPAGTHRAAPPLARQLTHCRAQGSPRPTHRRAPGPAS